MLFALLLCILLGSSLVHWRGIMPGFYPGGIVVTISIIGTVGRLSELLQSLLGLGEGRYRSVDVVNRGVYMVDIH